MPLTISIREKDKLTENDIKRINDVVDRYVESSKQGDYYISEFDSDMIIIN